MKKRRYITKILVFILVLGISFVNIGSFDVEAANNKEEKKAKKPANKSQVLLSRFFKLFP